MQIAQAAKIMLVARIGQHHVPLISDARLYGNFSTQKKCIVTNLYKHAVGWAGMEDGLRIIVEW